MSNWAELKAAYRLFDNDEVTYDRVLRPHLFNTHEACAEPGEYLLIEDTSSLDFSFHKHTTGLGPIGDHGGRGMHLHSTLAVKIESFEDDGHPNLRLLGLLGQKCWVRSDRVRKGESKKQRLLRSRESERWASVLADTGGPPEGARWTYVADRESDIYEVFESCRSNGCDFIIRACQARALSEEDGSIFDAVASEPILGSFSLDLRTRPGVAARTASLEVRSCQVTLRGPWRPGKKLAPLTLNLVEVKEVNAPQGVTPIHWKLLTSWPCESFAQVCKIIKTYTQRWLIEEYHKALKTGARMEKSQLADVGRLQALLGVLAVVAVRLLGTKLLARTDPDAPVTVNDEAGADLQAILGAKFGKPKGGWTNKSLLLAIARMGGFLARKGDGSPGWLTIWRGYYKLRMLGEGMALARELKRCG